MNVISQIITMIYSKGLSRERLYYTLKSRCI